MKTKHTPGPWRMVHGVEDTLPAVLAGRLYVATEVFSTSGHKGNAEANANLIAAAPELLSALEALTTSIHLHGGTIGETWYSLDEDALTAARAAIARAKEENES